MVAQYPREHWLAASIRNNLPLGEVWGVGKSLILGRRKRDLYQLLVAIDIMQHVTSVPRCSPHMLVGAHTHTLQALPSTMS